MSRLDVVWVAPPMVVVVVVVNEDRSLLVEVDVWRPVAVVVVVVDTTLVVLNVSDWVDVNSDHGVLELVVGAIAVVWDLVTDWVDATIVVVTGVNELVIGGVLVVMIVDGSVVGSAMLVVPGKG